MNIYCSDPIALRQVLRFHKSFIRLNPYSKHTKEHTTRAKEIENKLFEIDASHEAINTSLPECWR